MPQPELKLIHNKKLGPPLSRPIYLICVFRDESLLLDYFISYYRALGVTHFIMIDNLSEDDSVDFLKKLENINIWLYRAEGSYKEAAFGTAWVNQLLDKHCVDQYCLTVDVDELFSFDTEKVSDLNQLIDSMESSGCNVVSTTLLDMYPKEINDDYKKGMSFLTHSSYFDTLNPVFYRPGTYYGVRVHNVGGVRERVFNTTVCILKFPFFKYNFSPLSMAPGYHFFQDDGKVIFESEKIKPFGLPCVLLHFKFIKPDLEGFFKRRVELNQDWDDSSEYRSYVKALPGQSSFSFYEDGYSQIMKGVSSLGDFFKPIDNPDLEVQEPANVSNAGNIVEEEASGEIINKSVDEKELKTLDEQEIDTLSFLQNMGVLIFGWVFRLFLTNRQYKKLKKKPRLFFKGSKNNIIRRVGKVLRLI